MTHGAATRGGGARSTLLTLTHTLGALTLTPDHVIEIDGSFQPAANALPGSKLGGVDGARSPE
eukprot:6450750-Prymnesium_polylepis.1